MEIKSTLSKYFNKQTALLAIGTIGLSITAIAAFSQGAYLTSMVGAVSAAFGARLWKATTDGRLNENGALKPPSP